MDYEEARINMLKQQIRTWDVLDDKILSLFSSIPREDFVPTKYRALAFADISIPLSHGQKMMTPMEEAKILQELRIKEDEKVLILGVDSGYLVTLISQLAGQVIYLDNDLESFARVKNKCTQYQLSNVVILIGNLYQGWQDLCPFDVILLTGSMPSVSEDLKNALSIKGRLFVVVGRSPVMEATIVTRLSEYTWRERKLFETERPRLLDVKENNQFVF